METATDSTTTTNPTGTSLVEPKLSAIEQIRLRMNPDVLLRGRVVFIGLGGIGMFLSKSVVTFMAGLQQALNTDLGEQVSVLLVDGDEFAPSNTYRMDVPAMGNKAVVLGKEMLEKFDALKIRWKPEYVTPDNIDSIIQDGDVVLLAVDNHKTRKLVSDHCQGLDDITLISGGNDGVDDGLRGTYGNVQVYLREDCTDLTAPITQYHPEIANPADKSPHELSCLELEGTGIPQLSLVNLAVASAMANALLRLLMPVAGERQYDECALDILDAVSQPHWISGQQEQA